MAKLLWPCRALVLLMVVEIRCRRLSLVPRQAASGAASKVVAEETVYRLQAHSDTDHLGNTWVATDIGELVFMQSYHKRYQKEIDEEMLVQHQIQFVFEEDPELARKQYTGFFNDSRTTHISTVGVWGGDRGGWMSLPTKLQCGSSDNFGDGLCCWKHLKFIKMLRASSLMDMQDKSTGYVFKNIFKSFKVPPLRDDKFVPHFFPEGWNEKRVQDEFDETSKAALRLFRRAFDELPSVPIFKLWKTNTPDVAKQLALLGMMPAAFAPFAAEEHENMDNKSTNEAIPIPSVVSF